MGRSQTNETRQRISDAMKKAHTRRKEENSPAEAAKQKAAENFRRGHPDGLAPSAVRNYGDFGGEPKWKSLPTSLRSSVEKDNPNTEGTAENVEETNGDEK